MLNTVPTWRLPKIKRLYIFFQRQKKRPEATIKSVNAQMTRVKNLSVDSGTRRARTITVFSKNPRA